MARHALSSALGALSLWLPIILVFAVQRSAVNMLIANVMGLLGFSVFWLIWRRFYPSEKESLWILVGVLFFGAFLLSAATTFVNGGFAIIHGWSEIRWLLLSSVFPPLLFLVAGTSGLLPSLLIVTLFLIYAVAQERTNRSDLV
jgi:hypothetical protein